MTDTVIHVGDVGTIIRLTIVEKDEVTPVDVSTSTLRKFYFLKPSGLKVNKTAVFNTDGIDGKLKYVVVAGDLDEAGTWQVQAYVEIGAANYWSLKTTMPVETTLL